MTTGNNLPEVSFELRPGITIRDRRQAEIQQWALDTFGESCAGNLKERAMRFLEEALELAQACDLQPEDVATLTYYVFNRPVGELFQEVGGVATSLMALCHQRGVSLEACEIREFNRIISKDPEFFRQKQNSKARYGVGSKADAQ